MTAMVRSLLLILGALVSGLGAVLAARPFSSVDTLGHLVAAALVALAAGTVLARPAPRVPATWFAGGALVVAGASVEATGSTVDRVALLAGIALILDGVAGLADGRPGGRGFGLVGALMGAALIGWPDKTVLLVAVVVGARALWAGVTVGWIGYRGTFDEAQPFEPGDLRRTTTTVASVVALVVAAAFGGASAVLHDRDTSTGQTQRLPVSDKPGNLVTASPYAGGGSGGVRAWRITYTTTREDGRPTIASGLVVAKEADGGPPRPVIAWAHGTTGIAPSCAPSRSTAAVTSSAIPALADALDEGWAIVAPDYTGLEADEPSPYLVGQGEARAVLDGVRAARQITGLELSRKTVAWGHSQGGHAVLWAGMIAPTYAPGVDLVGVAGIAPATDLPDLLARFVKFPAASLVLLTYVISAYSDTYPDVGFDDYVKPAARAPVRKIAELCATDGQQMVAASKAFDFSQPFYQRDPVTGPLGSRLEDNVPDGTIKAPVLIAQGALDPVVVPQTQAAYVAERCAKAGNGPLEYKEYPDREHVNIVAADSPMINDLVLWTSDRFDGKEAPTTCS
ncbi:alpha-beta hydrolase superfamily lysophospholipase [Marmoricola sp. OAE513]|uniref:alpha/beta fold hydrolase n=1 Tax=Marmoricola sp. OAE513 TaxID=2817894 RepID=UPI001AE4BB83